MLRQLFGPRAPRQHSELTTIHRDGTRRQVIHKTRDWIEAPNWSPDGRWLVFNGGGRLHRIAADGTGKPALLDTGAIHDCDCHHLFAPDGRTLYFTAAGCIHALPLVAGPIRKVSTDHMPGKSVQYALHGVSPDGRLLCCTGVLPGSDAQAIFTLPATGGVATRITRMRVPVDGPEFSPDGLWIYFNGEIGARCSGDSQLFRMRSNGSGIALVLRDERVNWLPHFSRDGQHIAYLSYAPATQGHPAGCYVLLRVMPAGGGTPANVVALVGGQGSINCNSWAPDSERLAYVAYPRDEQ
jgi:Tol biopolymer transport system component